MHETPCHGKRRIRIRGIEPQIRIALIVLKQDIVIGLILFNKIILKQQGLQLGIRHDIGYILHAFHKCARFGVKPPGRMKIAAHPVGKILGLAHIDYLSAAVFHYIYAGTVGKQP